MKSRTVFLCSLFFALLAMSISAQDAPSPILPNTAVGRRVEAYLKAFNSHDGKIFANFLNENLSQRGLAIRSVEERIRIYRQMYDDLGRLALQSVNLVTEDRLVARFTGANGPTVEIAFQFDPRDAFKIEGARVELKETSGDKPASTPKGEINETPNRVTSTLISQPASVDLKALGNSLQNYLSRIEGLGFTGAVLVAKNGQVLVEKGYGEANRTRRIPFTRETVFDIGSNAKDFTRMAILQLAERQKINLEDPITKYFQNVPANKRSIRVVHLMRHTAGLVQNIGPDPEKITRDEMIRRVFVSELISEPGKEFHYSNAGYSMLASLIEFVTGQTYDQYVQENILTPAGMTRTGYALPQWRAGEIAHSYANGIDEGSTFDYPHFPDGASWTLRGNGGMLSTLGDMYKFHLILEGEKLLSTSIEQGNASQRVNIRSRDEFGALSMAFNSMADNLARAELLRRNMVNDVAHELRTPLTNLRCQIETLQDGLAVPGTEIMESLHSEVMLLSRLVDDLQDLALAEAGQLSLTLERVDLKDVVGQTLAAMGSQIAISGLSAKVVISDDCPDVLADSRRLGQVFRNLIKNAIEHSFGGGTITIRAVPSNSHVELSVEDTGRGIPAKDIPYVFERFYRADSSRDRTTGGAGLGLAIVELLVTLQGGQIKIESEVGRGTKTAFTLPVFR